MADERRSCGRTRGAFCLSAYSSSDSSSPSSTPVSTSTSGDPTSESEGDIQLPRVADEGIYGWICSLIQEGKVARFLDRIAGIYELDWQDVVWKYWFEWRAKRKDVKSATFNHRSASNTLRAALLNAHKERGAEEFPEKKVLDRENRTVKRCFRLPSSVVEKLSRQQNKTQVDGSKKSVNGCAAATDTLMDTLNGSTTTSVKIEKVDSDMPASALASFLPDFNPLDVDLEESDSLIDYMFKDWSPTNDRKFGDLPQCVRAINQYTASSSGYESSGDVLQNIVQEMDPCEGPYQGGNKSYIFLKEPFNSRSPSAERRCKVFFASPKLGFSSRCEVTGVVKNPFTIQVLIPHCPKLFGEQLACSTLTVEVVVETLEGCYVGETEYTYNVNLLEQFENCVKALDDDDMEIDFTGTPDEQNVLLHYNRPDTSGSHVFNYSTLRVLVLVAVKEKADNLLSAFLRSSVVPCVFQHWQHQLSSLVEVCAGEKESGLSNFVQEICKRLSLESADKDDVLEKEHSLLQTAGTESPESKEKMKKIDEGYDGGSETNHEPEVTSYGGSTLKLGVTNRKGEEKLVNHLSQQIDKTETKPDSGDDVTNEDRRAKESAECDVGVGKGLGKAKMFVVRKPCSPVPVCRSKSGFPDPRTDVFVELQIRKEPKTAFVNGCNTTPTNEHVTSHKQATENHVMSHKQAVENHVTNHKQAAENYVISHKQSGENHVTSHKLAPENHMTNHKQAAENHVTSHKLAGEKHVTVSVKHFGTDQSAKDWDFKYVKRPSGKLGYWFRFYEPNCELLLVFYLCQKPKPERAEMKQNKDETEVLTHVTIYVETISWRSPFSKGAKSERDVYSLELSLPCQVPLVSPSRSQTRLCKIMKLLHKCCDNGDWEMFEKTSSTLRRQFDDDIDMDIAILLEKAIAFLYQDDLEQAEFTAMQALEMVSKAENHQLLTGRAYYYLANVYRREKKLGKAAYCVELSKQNFLHLGVCLDWSFMAYEEGNVMLDFISSASVLKQKLVVQAKQCFERSLDFCKQLDDGSLGDTFPRTHNFALIKMAMLLLDCGTTSGRDRSTSVDHISEAKRFLDGLEKHGLEGITKRRQIQFLLANSDLQYRLANYQTALSVARQALEKATVWGFTLEVLPARERLNHIWQLLASGKTNTCVKH